MKTARWQAGFGIAFLFAAYTLAAIAVAAALRDWLAPSIILWSSWSVTELVLAAGGAVTLSVAGVILRRSAHQIRRRTADSFLSGAESDRVVAAIRDFENKTSGEIRVHIDERSSGGSTTTEATRVFERLGMTKTRARNGVLFYVSVRKRTLAVVGDTGIHNAVSDDFWQRVVTAVEARFGGGDFAGGLVDGIALAGAALAEHFPPRADNGNELPDEISERP